MTPAYAAVLLVPLLAALVILVTGANVPVFRALQQGSHVVPGTSNSACTFGL
jgi:hypothetical protein